MIWGADCIEKVKELMVKTMPFWCPKERDWSHDVLNSKFHLSISRCVENWVVTFGCQQPFPKQRRLRNWSLPGLWKHKRWWCASAGWHKSLQLVRLCSYQKEPNSTDEVCTPQKGRPTGGIKSRQRTTSGSYGRYILHDTDTPMIS